MLSTLSNTVASIDKWAMPVTIGMPALVTLAGAVFLSNSIANKEGGNRMIVGIIATSLGTLSLYSPKCGRLASTVSLVVVGVLIGVNMD